MKKMLVFLLLVLCTIYTILPVSAEEYKPCSNSLVNSIAKINISGGQVVATGGVTIIIGGSVHITVYLQKKSGSSWVTIASTSGNSSVQASASAEKGSTYRAKVSYALYNGGNMTDSGTNYSNELTYN